MPGKYVVKIKYVSTPTYFIRSAQEVLHTQLGGAPSCRKHSLPEPHSIAPQNLSLSSLSSTVVPFSTARSIAVVALTELFSGRGKILK